MQVRITRQPTVCSADGIPLSHLETGGMYALPVEVATLLIVEGWAEPVLDAVEPPRLPPVQFKVLAPPRARRTYGQSALRAAIAADRPRGK